MGISLGGKSPGVVVPSSEQKQSGSTQTAGSHGGARFGSLSISKKTRIVIFYVLKIRLNVPHEFSSDPSVQSFSPLQKRPRSIQVPSPQAKNPS